MNTLEDEVIRTAIAYVAQQRKRWSGSCSLPEVLRTEIELMHAVDDLQGPS